MANNTTVDIVGKNDKLKKSLDESENLVTTFGRTVRNTFAVIGAAMAVRQVVSWASGWVDAAAEAAEVESRLQAVLEATGHAAGFTTDQLTAYSSKLQDITKFEAETTQGAMAIIATFKNVRGDQFLEATKLAQDMATVLGGDLSGAAMQVAKALNDPLVGITALTRSGVSFTEQQKEMIKTLVESGDIVGAQKVILEELAGEFGGAAEKVGAGFTGKIEQAKNRMGDIAEELGGVLIDAFLVAEPYIQGTIAFIENLVPILKESAEGFGVIAQEVTGFSGILEYLGEVAVTVFTAYDHLINTWELRNERATLEAQRLWEQLTGTFEHIFSDVLPPYFEWFGQNWWNLWKDAYNAQNTVLENMGKNLLDFLNEVTNWLAGDGFNFKPTGLLEGFEASISELPEIADRVMSQTEIDLQKRIKALDDQLSADFGERYNKNKESLMSMFRRDTEASETDMEDTASDVYAAADREAESEKRRADRAEKELADKDKETEQSENRFEGLESLAQRIQEAAARSPLEQKQLEVQEELIAVEEKVAGRIDVLAETLEELDNSINEDFLDLFGTKQEEIDRSLKSADELAEIDDAAFAEEQNRLMDSQLNIENLLQEVVNVSKENVSQQKQTNQTIDSVGRLY